MEKKSAAGVEVGEVVNYVPGRMHARQCNAKREFPWVMGWQHQRMRGGELHTEVEVLSPRRLAEMLEYVDKHSDKATESKKLVPVAPAHFWPAKVVAVNDDGTVDLDIQAHWCESYSCGNGVTLTYRGIRVTDGAKLAEVRAKAAASPHAESVLAHTCHRRPK